MIASEVSRDERQDQNAEQVEPALDPGDGSAEREDEGAGKVEPQQEHVHRGRPSRKRTDRRARPGSIRHEMSPYAHSMHRIPSAQPWRGPAVRPSRPRQPGAVAPDRTRNSRGLSRWPAFRHAGGRVVPTSTVDRTGRAERRQQRVGLAGHDLVGQQLARDQAQRRPAVAEGHVVARDALEPAEHRLAVPGIGFGPTPKDVQLEPRVALEDRRRLAQEPSDRRLPHLVGPVRPPHDLLLRPGGVEHEGARGIGSDGDPRRVEDGAQGDVDGLGPDEERDRASRPGSRPRPRRRPPGPRARRRAAPRPPRSARRRSS